MEPFCRLSALKSVSRSGRLPPHVKIVSEKRIAHNGRALAVDRGVPMLWHVEDGEGASPQEGCGWGCSGGAHVERPGEVVGLLERVLRG
jgi:hypothetical protein